MYISKHERYRIVATLRDPASEVMWLGAFVGSLAGPELHSRVVGHRFVIVEPTTGSEWPECQTFLIIDMDTLGIEPTGEFLPEIVGTFHDLDAAIMALRMTR